MATSCFVAPTHQPPFLIEAQAGSQSDQNQCSTTVVELTRQTLLLAAPAVLRYYVAGLSPTTPVPLRRPVPSFIASTAFLLLAVAASRTSYKGVVVGYSRMRMDQRTGI